MAGSGFTVYRGLARGLAAGLAGSQWGSALSEFVLFADGGYRYGLPPRGLPSEPDLAEVPSRWGSWTETDGVVEVTRDNAVESRLRREGDLLVDDDGAVEWHALTGFPQGTRLEGSYARADFHESGAPRISFSSGGLFETTGSFASMIGSLLNVLGPPTDDPLSPGSGVYTVGGFQLALDFADGRRLRFALLPAPGDPEALQLSESLLTRD